MSEPRLCPQCGSQLPTDAPDGLCPRCLLQLGFESQGESTPTAAYQPRSLPLPIEELAARFPQLEILEQIGQGGMGVVYKARQTNLDRVIALKILRSDIEGDPAFAERFVREARALAKLSHPAIVTVHDFGRVDGLYYFIMEYVDGVNLRELERSGKLQPQQALALVPQICEALQYAHDQGVVHRDIKPENILIDTQGRVKIADFGLAKMLGTAPDTATLTGIWQIMGTPHYMAPEQMQSTHQVDHRADIYSLGVVLYEMLTGELPVGRFPLPSQKAHLDVRLDEVVLRSLEREPERRYQHASEVKTDVETICGSQATGQRRRDVAPDAAGPPPTAPDWLMARRLFVFFLVVYAVWVGLQLTAHIAYVRGAEWFFNYELPRRYLEYGMLMFGGWTLYILVWLWYLHAKEPDVPRSWANFWDKCNRGDARSKRLALYLFAFLGIWIAAMVAANFLATDATKALVLGLPFLLGPVMFIAGLRWCYGRIERPPQAPSPPSGPDGNQTKRRPFPLTLLALACFPISLWWLVSAGFMLALPGAGEHELDAFLQDRPGLRAWNTAVQTANDWLLLPLAYALFAAGVGLLLMRPWGRLLALGWAVVQLVVGLASLPLLAATIFQAFALGSEGQPDATVLLAGFLGTLLIMALEVAFPIVVLVVLNRPHIKQMFSRPAMESRRASEGPSSTTTQARRVSEGSSPADWWLRQSPEVRKSLRSILWLLFVFLAIVFLSFSLREEGSALPKPAQPYLRIIEVGAFDPWMRWEYYEGPVGANTYAKQWKSSGVNFLTWSMLAGLLAAILLSVLVGIQKLERANRDGSAL